MSKIIRVLLVDDHSVVRAGTGKILEHEPDIKVVGEAADGKRAIEEALKLKPDVILMDIQMPGLSGLEAIKIIKQRLPAVRIIIFTISEDENDLFCALLLGAQGYLSKDASFTEVKEAIRNVAAGEVILSPSMATLLVEEFMERHGDTTKLSQREFEILALLGQGLSNVAIGERLFISESTVRTHLQRLLKKLHLENRAGAISYAALHHYLPAFYK